jgi:hypothetical protein
MQAAAAYLEIHILPDLGRALFDAVIENAGDHIEHSSDWLRRMDRATAALEARRAQHRKLSQGRIVHAASPSPTTGISHTQAEHNCCIITNIIPQVDSLQHSDNVAQNILNVIYQSIPGCSACIFGSFDIENCSARIEEAIPETYNHLNGKSFSGMKIIEELFTNLTQYIIVPDTLIDRRMVHLWNPSRDELIILKIKENIFIEIYKNKNKIIFNNLEKLIETIQSKLTPPDTPPDPQPLP